MTEVYIGMIRRSEEDFEPFVFDNKEAQQQFLRQFLLDLIRDRLEKSTIEDLVKEEFETLENTPTDVLELICCDLNLGFIHEEVKPIHSNIKFMNLWR